MSDTLPLSSCLLSLTSSAFRQTRLIPVLDLVQVIMKFMVHLIESLLDLEEDQVLMLNHQRRKVS